MKAAVLALLLTIASCIAAVSAETGTARWLVSICKNNDDKSSRTSCAAFLLGSAGILTYVGKVYQEKDLDKDFVAVLQILGTCGGIGDATVPRQVFLEWAERHADRLDDYMSIAVKEAFIEKWPCSERSN